MQKGQYVQPKNNFPVEDYDENARAVFALRTKNGTRTRLLLWNGVCKLRIINRTNGINLIWYALIFGIHFSDNSLFWYLGVNIFILILCQPVMMRYARVIYLYFFVKYDDKQL